MIEIVNLSKKYIKNYYTLLDVNMQIIKNTLIVDESMGACCLFRILSKIDSYKTGQIFVDFNELKNIKRKNLSVAYLPQTPVIFKNKSVFYNLAYPLKIRKCSKTEIATKIDKICNLLQFDILNKKAKELNENEQKLLTLARAVLWQPKYLLLERFFENLPKEYILIALNLLENLKEKTIVIATEKTLNKQLFKGFDVVNFNK